MLPAENSSCTVSSNSRIRRICRYALSSSSRLSCTAGPPDLSLVWCLRPAVRAGHRRAQGAFLPYSRARRFGKRRDGRARRASSDPQLHCRNAGRPLPSGTVISGRIDMRKQAVLVALALVLAPLGVQAADLVVWWEEGFYPQEDEAVREIIAAFEQGSGKQVELALLSAGGAAGQARRRRSLRAGRPTSRSAHALSATSRNGPSTIGSWTSRTLSATSRTCSIRTRWHWYDVARREDRTEGTLRATDGPHDQPCPRLEEPPGTGGVHPRRHPEGVECLLVVLVRSGPAGGAPGHGARRHLGRRPQHVGRGRPTHRISSSSS